jgi:hypothetical protein
LFFSAKEGKELLTPNNRGPKYAIAIEFGNPAPYAL